jgi:Glycosyl hydrolases family 16
MHIRMFRATGQIHSATLVPKAAIGMQYGMYVERFSVTAGSSWGYKSAHLLWPTGTTASTPLRYEVDFPEGAWKSNFVCVFVHSALDYQQARFCPSFTWTGWHTSITEWTPSSLTFFLDGKKIGSVTGSYVPHEPMSWILQNESAIRGPMAPQNSWGQLNIDYVAVYSYRGKA